MPIPRLSALLRRAHPLQRALTAELDAQLRVVRYLARWALLLAPVVLATGALCALFLRLLDEATELRGDYGWLILLMPAGGLAGAALYHWLGQGAERGSNLVVDEIHEPAAGVPPKIVPLILVTTVLSHVVGASVGREGTAVQMGGGVAAWCARRFRLPPEDVRILLMAGVAAGFGAVFGTPLAGAVFAMEVLTIGRMEYRALVPVLIAALGADYVTAALGGHHTAYHVALPARGDLPFDPWLMAKALIAGGVFGLTARLFAEAAHRFGAAFRRAVVWPLLRPVVGGVIILLLVAALGTRDFLGLGVSSDDPTATTIVSAFRPGGAASFDWAWKILFTAICIGAGFRGGEVTPLFFIGATLGNQLGVLLDAPVDLFAGLGFVAVFAGAANTPLACTFMGVELFGAGPAGYLAAACFVAYLVSGHRGIYLSQRIHAPKLQWPGSSPG